MTQHTLIQNIENGGLKVCHFETKVKALRLSWLKRLTSESQSNYKILEYFMNAPTYTHISMQFTNYLIQTQGLKLPINNFMISVFSKI